MGGGVGGGWYMTSTWLRLQFSAEKLRWQQNHFNLIVPYWKYNFCTEALYVFVIFFDWRIIIWKCLSLWTWRKCLILPLALIVYWSVLNICFTCLISFHRLAAGRMHVVHDSVSLPVLRPNGAANVADRKRRQQALVRGRGKKDFY